MIKKCFNSVSVEYKHKKTSPYSVKTCWANVIEQCYSSTIAPTGQTFAQVPQPAHLSWSIT